MQSLSLIWEKGICIDANMPSLNLLSTDQTNLDQIEHMEYYSVLV